MSEMFKDFLKCCPFCGGEVEIRMDTDSSGGGLYVYAVCTGCGIHGAPVWALPGVKERRAAAEEVVRGGIEEREKKRKGQWNRDRAGVKVCRLSRLMIFCTVPP